MADDYEDRINSLLECFGANFRFCQAKANYVGEANVQYCININGHALNVSDNSNGSRPSFKTALSSGDKMSLALSLFITQVKNRTDIKDLIIRSEEHTSELQSLMRISYADFCLKKKTH